MKRTKHLAGKVAFLFGAVLLGALTGCVGYVDQPRPREVYVTPPPAYAPPPPVAYVPPPPVYAQPPPVYAPPAVQVEGLAGSVGVEIRSESDFYEPLRTYGRWEVVGAYGRCWIPGRVDPDWRPYCQGRWERTDAGWYWASDEPWAWATYHYGRWDLSPEFGWYWVPQTQWAPAWVSWHEGGGYVGWAPLQPTARVSVGGSVELNVALIAPRAYVFVEPKRFLEPVRPSTVVVNNTTIINKTVNITNIKVVNNAVINEGPRTQVIEQASGQTVQAVPVRELRRKQEAAVVAQQRIATPISEKKPGTVQTPARSEAVPRDTKAPLGALPSVKASDAATQEQSQRNAKELEAKTQAESQRRANETAAKTQEEAQTKAKASEKTAQIEAQQRSKELEKEAQAEARRTAAALENKTQAESQRHANEAAAKLQEEARSKAKESERIAKIESQQHGKELEKKAQAEAESKPNPKLEPHPNQRPIAGEQVGTNKVKKAKNTKPEGKPSSPDAPPAPPKSSP